MFYVLTFLISIVLANLSVAYFGSPSIIFNAFILIGLDLSLRDKLHETWHNKGLAWKMTALVVASGIVTYLLNQGAGKIALASVIAFCGSMIVDAIVYQVLIRKSKLVKMNGSNLFSAAVDSILFPTIAFGVFMPWIILGQFAAKVGGGFIWSVILTRYIAPRRERR